MGVGRVDNRFHSYSSPKYAAIPRYAVGFRYVNAALLLWLVTSEPPTNASKWPPKRKMRDVSIDTK